MGKRFWLLSLVVLVLIPFIATQPSYAAAVNPIELKLAHHVSPMHSMHAEVFAPFAKQVEEKTNGRVKITIYPAEALGKLKDQYDNVVSGIADMAFFAHGYTAGRFPLTSVIELPLEIPSAKVGARVLWELYDKQHLKSEYSDAKLLGLWVHDTGGVFSKKIAVRTMADAKGLRLRGVGPVQNAIIKALGAAPINIPVPELYDAFQRGMADGAVLPFSTVPDFKLVEVLGHFTAADLYVMSFGLVMNKKSWDSLPADIQKIIGDLAGVQISETAGAVYDKYGLLGKDKVREAKAGLYQFSPEERKKFAEEVKPISDKWVADMEAKGLPGRKVLDDTRQLIDKFSK
jgi:TRAP-type transport system periplasmic protein